MHTSLKFVTSGSLLVMFWVKISQATAKGDLSRFSPWMILAVTGLGTAVVASFLFITFILATLLRLPKESILAVTVLSSARNSSIAIAVIENLPERVGDKDLMFFPIIFVYLAMIVIINSFGYVLTIKKEGNDIGLEIEDEPFLINNDSANRLFKRNEILETLDSVDSKKSTGGKDKLIVIINPLEQLTSHHTQNNNVNDHHVTLPTVQWCSSL